MRTRRRKLIELIEIHHRGRDPLRLRIKYELMARDAFAFLRGTSFLFWEDWPRRSALNDAPVVWSSGDLHAENFGSFRGSDRITYFDLNDFDEALLAPCTFDLVRLLASLEVAASALALSVSGRRLGLALLKSYRNALAAGKPLWTQRATAEGLIKALLNQVKSRPLDQLIRERCMIGKRPRIRLDGIHAYAATKDEQIRVARLLSRALDRLGLKKHRIWHVARRIAGNGSLGVERYLALVEHVFLGAGYALLDIKRALPSSAVKACGVAQRKWRSDAERVVTTQNLLQAVSPAMLSTITDGNRSYVFRELMPSEDRVRLKAAGTRDKKLLLLAQNLGSLLAWDQLRSSGRQGAATADELIAYAQRNSFTKPALDYAARYAKRVRADWKMFRKLKGAV